MYFGNSYFQGSYFGASYFGYLLTEEDTRHFGQGWGPIPDYDKIESGKLKKYMEEQEFEELLELISMGILD